MGERSLRGVKKGQLESPSSTSAGKSSQRGENRGEVKRKLLKPSRSSRGKQNREAFGIPRSNCKKGARENIPNYISSPWSRFERGEGSSEESEGKKTQRRTPPQLTSEEAGEILSRIGVWFGKGREEN